MRHFIAAALCLHLLVASVFGADLYHLTFDSPIHTVGSPVSTGVSSTPRSTPSARIFGTSVVVPTFAGVNNPAMRFVPTNVTDSSFTYSQYAFDLTPFKGFTQYRVDFDLILSNFQTDGGPFGTTPTEDFFSLIFDLPSVVRLDFTDLGFIHEKTGNVGSFQFGTVMHIATEVDLARNEWGILKDGIELYRGQFFYPYPAAPNLPTTIGAIRLNLADSVSFPGSPIAEMDNLRIQVPEPSATSLIISSVVFFLAAAKATSGKHQV